MSGRPALTKFWVREARPDKILGLHWSGTDIHPDLHDYQQQSEMWLGVFKSIQEFNQAGASASAVDEIEVSAKSVVDHLSMLVVLKGDHKIPWW